MRTESTKKWCILCFFVVECTLYDYVQYLERKVSTNMSQKHLQSIHVSHFKHTAGCASEVMPTPDVVKISMSQHIGAPCKPLVAKGDTVKVGQLIGDTDAFVSAPIHSSVSGTVTGIEQIRNAMGNFDTLVVIETDKKQEPYEGITVPEEPADLAGFVAEIRKSGLVGLGGASFPTSIKFNPKNIDDVHCLIVNAAECEPFITADHRCMLEDTEDLIKGCQLIMKYDGLDRGYIGIEDNKQDAIDHLNAYLKSKGITNIETFPLQARYPKGAERVLVYEILGKDYVISTAKTENGTVTTPGAFNVYELYKRTTFDTDTYYVLKDGNLDMDAFRKALTQDTILVSVMHVNIVKFTSYYTCICSYVTQYEVKRSLFVCIW